MRNFAYLLAAFLLTLVIGTQTASAAAFAPAVGGTGTVQAPNYGQVLVGTAGHVYVPTATSSIFANSSAGITGLLTGSDWTSFNSRLSTTSLGLFDKGYFFSTTSVNYWAQASTTLPKTYGNNTFTGTNAFANITATGATTTFLSTNIASTSILYISGVSLCTGSNALQTNAAGLVSCGAISAGSSASTTLLVDSNTFSGNNTFTQPLSVIPAWLKANGITFAYASSSLNSATIFGINAGGGPATTTGIVGAGTSAFGADVLSVNSSGIRNSGFGYQALRSNTSGGSNTAVGYLALTSITTGTSNTAIGSLASQLATTSSSNTAVGSNALTNNGGTGNTAVGASSFSSNKFGSFNTALGTNSGQSGTGDYWGNTMIGYRTAFNGSGTFSSSTALGYQAGFSNVASNNLFLGALAGSSLTTGTGNIFIGTNIDAASTTANNQLNIQNIIFGTNNGGTGTSISTGSIGIATNTPGTIFSVQGVVNFHTATSTFYSSGGLNLTAGCYAINGVCIGGGAGSGASSTLLTDINSFTGASNSFLNITTTGATSTSLSVSGTASSTNLWVSSVRNGLLNTSATGQVQTTSFSGPLSFTGGTLTITPATAGQNGYLTSTDWSSFNARLSTTSLGLIDKGFFFSTTSASYFTSAGLGFSTTSADFWLTTKTLSSFSTTSANFWASVGLAHSTTSANYWASVGLGYSTTSENYYQQSSSTVPTMFKANTWTGLNTFANASSTLHSFATAVWIPNSSSQAPTQLGQLAQDTTDNQLKLGTGGSTAVFDQRRFLTFPFSTTTAMTGSTTLVSIPVPIGMTFDSMQCKTDRGTVNVQVQYGAAGSSTVFPAMVQASTTMGTFTWTTNNTPGAGATTTATFGTPSGSPTQVGCTVTARPIGT